ncbi:hypothetical protein K402DRAFT_248992 [Aulographum hederae CBS 113979]|uniref:Uncharacterized protein n=1 Tax=Aulographum hederae CBS 113979 TaxID=1176131 RepID=A0A6G1HAB1_9PEZI|nr:hypothetical protein K402DRAFT_248992 [Aulographum hederae CBS 113979]
MFDVPKSKRVRREELDSPQSSISPEPDPAIQTLIQTRLDDELGPIESISLENASENADTEGEALGLRLFTRPIGKSTSAHIIVREESISDDDREPGLVNPERDKSYYFAKPLDAEQLRRYESIAVDTADIIVKSKDPCPGLRHPWRSTAISATGKILTLLGKHVKEELVSSKRKRPGKVARIKSRKKIAAEDVKKGLKASKVQEKKIAKSALNEEETEAEREKRMQRNREKKAKKKLRHQAKKVTDGTTESAAETGAGPE